MRRLTVLAVLAGSLLVACGGDPGTGDFQDEAESFIESDEYAESPNVGQAFTDAECEEPASTDVGTAYTCTGVGADGQTYSFAVTITGENTLEVAPPSVGAATTAPPATTAS
jgi:hypothetical protein